jgi:hypothetical protein
MRVLAGRLLELCAAALGLPPELFGTPPPRQAPAVPITEAVLALARGARA